MLYVSKKLTTEILLKFFYEIWVKQKHNFLVAIVRQNPPKLHIGLLPFNCYSTWPLHVGFV